VAGVDVLYNSGQPGGDVQLALRGVTTITGSPEPLYVVDGLIMDRGTVETGVTAVTGGHQPTSRRIVDVNPLDIASVTVLRGAAATAFYGSLGANGVVVITTRRGSERRVP
jgi:TonB-dependent SusC/RagA subfamily outer membrane receptor